MIIGIIAVLIAITFPSIIIIPTVNYGLVLRFSRRTGRVLKEGLRFIIPFIEKVQLFEYKQERTPIDETFLAHDQFEVRVKGSILWQPDRRLLKTFIQRSEDSIRGGMGETVQSILGIVAGQKGGSDFIREREAIDLLINAVLRLETPPHINKAPGEWLAYYNDNRDGVREALEVKTNGKKKKNMEDEPLKSEREISDIERLFGIEIHRFALADVSFGEATTKALEQKKQNEARADAAQSKLRLIDEYIYKGVTPQQAIVASEVSLGESEKRKSSHIDISGIDIPAIIKVLKGKE